MNRRVIGVVVSLLLALVGTWVLVRYVSAADERALEGQETVEVLVVDEAVDAGVPAEQIGDRVSTALVPANVRAAGSIDSLDVVKGQVTGVELVPGEQVLASRFVAEEEQTAEEVRFEVPPGLLEVTVRLTPERAVGGTLRPGETVAVVASFNPFTLDASEPEGTDDLSEFLEPQPGAEVKTLSTPHTTHITVHKAVITRIHMASTAEQPVTQVEATPSGSVFVTLAVEAPDIERIVFSAEFGSLWLAREQDTSSEDGTKIVTRGNVYR